MDRDRAGGDDLIVLGAGSEAADFHLEDAALFNRYVTFDGKGAW